MLDQPPSSLLKKRVIGRAHPDCLLGVACWLFGRPAISMHVWSLICDLLLS